MLVTAGLSETDGTPAADKIKAANHTIFTIGINTEPIAQLDQIASVGYNNLKNVIQINDYNKLKFNRNLAGP